MSLKDKIRQYGYEIEYPMQGKIVYLEDSTGINPTTGIDYFALIDKYSVHYDSGGWEFSIQNPVATAHILKNEIATIYRICDDICAINTSEDYIDDIKGNFEVEESLFDSNSVGVHIRLDVTDWTKQQRLRYLRLISFDMECYDDYIDWFTNNARRDWNNYNDPPDYNDLYDAVRNGYTSEKFYNVRYEVGRFGREAITIENRFFAVPPSLSQAQAQVDFIHTLCDIVDCSMTITSNESIPAKLYIAWKHVVLGTPIYSTTTAQTLTNEREE